MPRELPKLLSLLSDDNEKLLYSLLGDLSDLDRVELAELQAIWPGINPARRQELIRALTEMAEEHVEYDFCSIFHWTLSDPDPLIRVLSIEGLWEEENPRLVPVFLDMLKHDDVIDVRAAAAVALGRFIVWSECGDIANCPEEDAIDVLWQILHDEAEHVDVRRRALESVAACSRPGITRLIENALFGNEPAMRPSALFAMGRTLDPRWIPYLISELNQPDPELRLESVRSLGELEARAAVSYIINLIARETDIDVAGVALEVLGHIGGDEARKALEAATEQDNEVLADAAEAVLDNLFMIEGNDTDLINGILGLDDDDEDFDLGDDYFEDPLEEELRRLLEERDIF